MSASASLGDVAEDGVAVGSGDEDGSAELSDFEPGRLVCLRVGTAGRRQERDQQQWREKARGTK